MGFDNKSFPERGRYPHCPEPPHRQSANIAVDFRKDALQMIASADLAGILTTAGGDQVVHQVIVPARTSPGHACRKDNHAYYFAPGSPLIFGRGD